MNRIVIVLTVLLLFIPVVLVLQYFLSRRPNRLPGLVLPGFTFLWSLLYVLSYTVSGDTAFWVIAGNLFLILLTGNIPTYLLLAIYWCAREKFRRQAQLDKMNAQDLE